MSLRLDLGERGFIDPPNPPNAAEAEQMRARFHLPPRVSEVWVHGERYTKKDGLSPCEVTVLSLVLDPSRRAKDLGETDGLLDGVGDYRTICPKLQVGFTGVKDFHEKNGTRERARGAALLVYARAPDATANRRREFRRKTWARRSVGAAAFAAVAAYIIALPLENENLGSGRFLLLMTPAFCAALLLGVWDASRE